MPNIIYFSHFGYVEVATNFHTQPLVSPVCVWVLHFDRLNFSLKYSSYLYLDPEEFLMLLLKDVLKVDPFLKIR